MTSREKGNGQKTFLGPFDEVELHFSWDEIAKCDVLTITLKSGAKIQRVSVVPRITPGDGDVLLTANANGESI